MKCLVIFKSKTGFTERYARWIAKEISADVHSYREINKETFKDYDVIVYGGSLHAIDVEGIKIIKDNLNFLKEKKYNLFIFVVVLIMINYLLLTRS